MLWLQPKSPVTDGTPPELASPSIGTLLIKCPIAFANHINASIILSLNITNANATMYFHATDISNSIDNIPCSLESFFCILASSIYSIIPKSVVPTTFNAVETLVA